MSLDAQLLELGDLTEIGAGYPFRSAFTAAADGPVAVVQLRDLRADEPVDWPLLQRTRLAGRKPPDVLRDGDIIFASRGTRFAASAVHEPPLPTVAEWPMPRAFEKRGYEWTKWVPITEIPADEPERALEELEAWFLRLVKGEEQPTGGRLTKSCAQWEDYEEDPKTQGWRVLWWEPREE